MEEAEPFYLLTAQLTVAASIYTFCWGKWFYPRLSPWLQRQLQNMQSSHGQTEVSQEQDEIIKH